MTAGTAKDYEREDLKRDLKSRHIQMIAIGGAIGTGLFYGSGWAVATAGPAIIATYAVASVAIYFIMRALGEMSVEEPVSGAYNISYANRTQPLTPTRPCRFGPRAPALLGRFALMRHHVVNADRPFCTRAALRTPEVLPRPEAGARPEAGKVRNELMHFNDKDKDGDDAIPKLRNMIELLRRYGSRGEGRGHPRAAAPLRRHPFVGADTSRCNRYRLTLLV